MPDIVADNFEYPWHYLTSAQIILTVVSLWCLIQLLEYLPIPWVVLKRNIPLGSIFENTLPSYYVVFPGATVVRDGKVSRETQAYTSYRGAEWGGVVLCGEGTVKLQAGAVGGVGWCYTEREPQSQGRCTWHTTYRTKKAGGDRNILCICIW